MRRDTRYGGVSRIISVFVLTNLSIEFVFVVSLSWGEWATRRRWIGTKGKGVSLRRGNTLLTVCGTVSVIVND